ncbi:MAG: quinone-interacting membrane-bound oxidoreductase complex subunit QmoC [Acidobacteriota bacterium]|jgi:quinone-modifying oxidoreductase subunit QmoC
MSQATLINPNPAFAQSVLEAGGNQLRNCFQCATCSVTCELAPSDHPFPRKEMIWAQWGLEDRLAADPDVWLCHQCGECSVRCPRDARPGEVLAAIRKLAVRHHSSPRFLWDGVNRPAFLPLMILFPALLLALALLLRDPVAGLLGIQPHVSEGMEYASLFPHWLLISFFSFFLGLSVLASAVGVVRFWRAMAAANPDQTRERPFLGSLFSVLRDILSHRKFRVCASSDSPFVSHFSLFYGFMILFAVSGWAVILLYVINPMMDSPLPYPFPFWDPAKILANIGALLFLGGAIWAIARRLRGDKGVGTTTAADWIFLGIVAGVGITGLASEALRFAQSASVGFPVYFVHLVLAFMLLMYLPYSKFAHIFYRTAALVYAEQAGRLTPRLVQANAPQQELHEKSSEQGALTAA